MGNEHVSHRMSSANSAAPVTLWRKILRDPLAGRSPNCRQRLIRATGHTVPKGRRWPRLMANGEADEKARLPINLSSSMLERIFSPKRVSDSLGQTISISAKCDATKFNIAGASS